jgi:flagellar motility protein MotE (MotC chaperone)
LLLLVALGRDALGAAEGASKAASTPAPATAPKGESSKSESAKPEKPKPESAKTDNAKAEKPKAEEAKAESAKSEKPKAEEAKADTEKTSPETPGTKTSSAKGSGGAPTEAAASPSGGDEALPKGVHKGPVVPRGSVGPGGVVKLVPGKGMDPKKMAKLRVNRPGSSAAALSPNGLRDEIKRNVSLASVSDGHEVVSRSRAEKILEEMAKTREALEKDTARLEAMHKEAAQAADALAAIQASLDAAQEQAKKAPAAVDPKTQKNPLDIVAKELRGIKATEAGPIVVRLDRKLAANILRRMPPADAGKILGAIKPDIAAEIASEIAEGDPRAVTVASKSARVGGKP